MDHSLKVCHFLPCDIIAEGTLDSHNYDGIIHISSPQAKHLEAFCGIINEAVALDPGLKTEVGVLPIPSFPAGRLVHAPTGSIDPDYNDVRIFAKAAKKGIERALKAQMQRPILVLPEYPAFPNCQLVTLLGALEALYVPLQVRTQDNKKVKHLGVYTPDKARTQQLLKLAVALESGRFIARDIGGGDPEQMAPPRVRDYVLEAFQGSSIKVTIVEDMQRISQEYPLFEAVNRAASIVERHRGCIIFLEYEPVDPANIKETLFLVGKGVTYDTGGADVKVDGHMTGMSRDKCGAAAVAGFMQTCNILRPSHLKVVAAMSMVRNSIGANGYVSDELIKSRAGALVRVVNTDAEGRMVMADVLCRMKEIALDSVNPHLMTIATLTGHALLTVGVGYSVAIDNGPAKKDNHAYNLSKCGETIGDPFEVSVLRQEDLEFHRGQSQGDDILQANTQPSSRTPRGHQGPAAFLLLASGLDRHGSGSAKPLKYSHLDIAGSSGLLPADPTGSPVLALAEAYILNPPKK